MTTQHLLKTLFFSFLCVNITFVYAMFDDTYDYYDQLDLAVNVPQNKILAGFTKKIIPYFGLVKENYPGKNLRKRLIAYDNQHGTPFVHKQYDKDKIAFDVLNNPAQRKAYDVHKGYNKPEPKAPTDYHVTDWCTGYCKKYIHKITAIDKEKLIGKKMPLACGHTLCVLCVQFDPIYGNGGNGKAKCPFRVAMPDCGCSLCPYRLEEHLVGNHAVACPKCHTPIANPTEMRQELMKNMSSKDYIYYMVPPALRPFATKGHFGFALISILTAHYVHYFNKKAQLDNEFTALEYAADLAVISLLSFEFEQFDDNNVLGLEERFNIEKLITRIKSEELKTSLMSKIVDFDAALKEAYDTICARYYYNTVEIFLQKEPVLVEKLNARLLALKEDINRSRAALGIKKTIVSPRLKSIAGLCIGGVTGLYVWSNIR